MLYVLLNSPEVEPYKQEFIREFWTASRLPEPHEIDTLISQGEDPSHHQGQRSLPEYKELWVRDFFNRF
jgi:hypothetical protein